MSFDPQKVMREHHEAQRSQNWFISKIHEFNAAHNRLKHHVHTAWRYPLPPWGRAIMGFVYFSIPVVAGYAVSSWVVSQSEATVKERFADAEKKGLLVNKTTIVGDENGEKLERIGAGGWGGGVHLVTSDQETQDINRVNLERFLRKQRKLKEKREREAAKEKDNQEKTDD